MKQKNATGKSKAANRNAGKSSQSKTSSVRAVNSADGSVTQELSSRGSRTGGRSTGSGNGSQQQGQNTSQQGRQNELPPLEKFFTDTLKDIYYAEQQLTKAIPKMEEAATTEELKEAFSDHLHQTQKQIKRLDKVFAMLGRKPEGKKCEAIEGLVKEVETIISETPQGTMTRDAALIIAAQKVEHYEIATYGGLVQLAITMELDDVSELLDDTLLEEEDTDYLLTQIAEGHINMDAEHEGANYSWKSRNNGVNNATTSEQEDSEEVEDVEEEA
jgi:ferritin-like metal-binding protein YciE